MGIIICSPIFVVYLVGNSAFGTLELTIIDVVCSSYAIELNRHVPLVGRLIFRVYVAQAPWTLVILLRSFHRALTTIT